MTKYRKFCYKSLVVVSSVLLFWLLAQVSMDAQADDFGKFVDAKVAEYENMAVYLYDDNGDMPTIIYNQKTKKFEERF